MNTLINLNEIEKKMYYEASKILRTEVTQKRMSVMRKTQQRQFMNCPTKLTSIYFVNQINDSYLQQLDSILILTHIVISKDFVYIEK